MPGTAMKMSSGQLAERVVGDAAWTCLLLGHSVLLFWTFRHAGWAGRETMITVGVVSPHRRQ